ncbi:MAG: SGNH/GDSL hydrolase family protein [Pseudomonadales bacterium]|nr:SGNH/GDSL hydrolase family protein [Pseudomonadales bacterium]
MKHFAKVVITFSAAFVLTACIGETQCEDYKALAALDRNYDGATDYRFHFIGDSILAYNNLSCQSVAHGVGFEINEQVLPKAVIGAKVHEIQEQFVEPENNESDYDHVIVNGGLNDLIASEKVGDPEAVPCDCNGALNHNACLQEIDDVTQRMQMLIENIHDKSSAHITLVGYYPAEKQNSFIGQCFPYVDLMNASYQEMAAGNDHVSFIQTYGSDQPIVSKVSQYGYDNYHPTPKGSNLMAHLIMEHLGLDSAE